MKNIEVNCNIKGYSFILYAGNGQPLIISDYYQSKEYCLKGIESAKKNAQDKSRYERLESKNGKFYFNLKATNGQIIATSERFESKASMENCIESVIKNIVNAEIIE